MVRNRQIKQIKQIKLKLGMDYYLSIVTKSFVLGTCLQNSCFSVILPVNTLRIYPVSPEEVSAG